MTSGATKAHRTLARARKAGAIAMGFIVGLLLVIALFEFARNLGDLSAFQYQGY